MEQTKQPIEVSSFQLETPCPECEGKGWSECDTCRGKGKVLTALGEHLLSFVCDRTTGNSTFSYR